MTARQSNVERLRKLYQAFEIGGDEAAAKLIGEIFDPDVEFNPLQAGEAGGRTYRGHQGLAGFFAELTESLGDVHYDPPQFHPIGDDLVIVFTRLVGTDKDTSMPLRQDLSLVYEFSDGLVRCVTAYDSPAEALQAAERGHADA